MKNFDYPRIYFYVIIAFAFTLPLSRAAISVLMGFIAIVWIVEGNFKYTLSQIVTNRVLKSIALFLIFAALSLLWTQDKAEGLSFLRLYGYWTVLFIIATVIQKKDIKNIITAFLLGMFVSEIIAYGVYFELWTFKNATVSNPSPFMFWIDYSIFMAFTSLLLLSRLFSKDFTVQQKLFIFLFFLSTTGNLFLTQGRTGQVALLAGIVVMLFLYLKPSIKSFFIGTILLVSIYGGAYTMSDTFQNRVSHAINDINLMKENNFDSSWGIRVVYWMITYDVVKEHPLIGVGLGDYETIVHYYVEKNDYPISQQTKEFIVSHHAHNQFLMVLIQTGLIGFILLLNIIYSIITLKIYNDEIKKLSILFITIFFVSCMAEPLWFKQFTIVLFVLFIGLFSSKSNLIRKIL
ncbi:MAG: O-antigen ligase family protein [Arcobacteraceae bacterium]